MRCPPRVFAVRNSACDSLIAFCVNLPDLTAVGASPRVRGVFPTPGDELRLDVICQASRVLKPNAQARDIFLLFFSSLIWQVAECRSSTDKDGGRNPDWQRYPKCCLTFYIPATVTLDHFTLTLDVLNDNLITDTHIGSTGRIALDQVQRRQQPVRCESGWVPGGREGNEACRLRFLPRSFRVSLRVICGVDSSPCTLGAKPVDPWSKKSTVADSL